MDAVPSPFHAGEEAVQDRFGVKARMAVHGRHAIRPAMPDQHRAFFAARTFLVVGSADEVGWPTASLLFGPPGFIATPDATQVRVAATPQAFDPLRENLRSGAGLGLLGIDLSNRRRNRVNGMVETVGADGFSLAVHQSFGNCDQYIQMRDASPAHGETPASLPAQAGEALDLLDAEAAALMSRADTFFVASCAPRGDGGHDCDVSHRGGRPGFVAVEENTLTIPDFPGNLYFNTFGNFALNPKAGLLFPDFETGELLFVWGHVEMLWEGARIQALDGALRAWRVRVTHAWRVPGAARALIAPLHAYSPATMRTGTWREADARLARAAAWRAYRVADVVQETRDIKSFLLEPEDGGPPPPFQAGQHLPIRLPGDANGPARCYSLSSAPGTTPLRITVKRLSAQGPRPEGFLSNLLHDEIRPGDRIEALPPRGDFILDPARDTESLLLSAGVGITPMMAMARAALESGTGRVVFVHCARTTADQPFATELHALARRFPERLRLHLLLTQPGGDAEATPGDPPHVRLDEAVLATLLPSGPATCFLCGPAGFMQDMYDALRRLGMLDGRIHGEAFGPAALRRTPDETAGPPADDVRAAAAGTPVFFVRSGIGRNFGAQDDSLLSVAEDLGLSLPSACRSGACGTCAQTLLSGAVRYERPPTAHANPEEVLLCCAVPAPGAPVVILA